MPKLNSDAGVVACHPYLLMVAWWIVSPPVAWNLIQALPPDVVDIKRLEMPPDTDLPSVIFVIRGVQLKTGVWRTLAELQGCMETCECDRRQAFLRWVIKTLEAEVECIKYQHNI